jgi:hypothetical protein
MIFMDGKNKILFALREELNRWEEMLSNLGEALIRAPHLPSNLSIKDVVAHLRAWQQVSIARLEAASLNREPVLPAWLMGLDPESESDRDSFNSRIYETNREIPWKIVHQDWRTGFLQLLELAEGIPENELLDSSRYPWLKGYSLLDMLEGSNEHHHVDHLEPLLAWLEHRADKQ